MFLPKKSDIFKSLLEQSLLIQQASAVFREFSHDWKKLKRGYLELEKMEKRGDEYVHAISSEIEKTFILPLDKEDLKDLTDSMDDILDNLEEVANRLKIYRIAGTNQSLKDFSELLFQSSSHIHEGLEMISKKKIFSEEFSECLKKLHKLENQGDELHRKVLESLMAGNSKAYGKNLLLLMKWKEIFQTLEDTLDKCEDVATIFERLRIKYG